MSQSSSSATTTEDQTKAAARVTLVFLTLYFLCFVNGLRTKKRLIREAKELNETFNRYTSLEMLDADRLTANFLEWSPIFLGLLWLLAATSNLYNLEVAVAWTYVALRMLYMVLIWKCGIASDGMQKHLWASTFPSYFCLVYLWARAVGVLFF